jgi:hypothetical protein
MPDSIAVGEHSFPFAQHLSADKGFPLVDWLAVSSWVDSLRADDLKAQAWSLAEKTWLQHMQHALGAGYDIAESPNAMLLSSMDSRVAQATLAYMERTLNRVVNVLDGIAVVPPFGKDLLIAFDDDDAYYRYVSCYYPDAGEFAFSSGMNINMGCSHYVVVKSDLRQIEPVIAHEMAHGCLGHLTLPVWLNEGLAVNTEQRLCPTPPTHTPRQLQRMHRAYWNPHTVQEFWAGKSFLHPGDANLLSYALARLLVEHLSEDWAAFARFAADAQAADGGAVAAQQHLNVNLGALVCGLLEAEPDATWEPCPSEWASEPGRGGFAQ